MIPCTQKQNVSWKKVLINEKKSKNLIYDYDNFTQEEINSFDEEKNFSLYSESICN